MCFEFFFERGALEAPPKNKNLPHKKLKNSKKHFLFFSLQNPFLLSKLGCLQKTRPQTDKK